MAQTRRGFLQSLGTMLAGVVGGGLLVKRAVAQPVEEKPVPQTQTQTHLSSDGEYLVQEATVVGSLQHRGYWAPDGSVDEDGFATQVWVPARPDFNVGQKVVTVAKITGRDKKTGMTYGEFLRPA